MPGWNSPTSLSSSGTAPVSAVRCMSRSTIMPASPGPKKRTVRVGDMPSPTRYGGRAASRSTPKWQPSAGSPMQQEELGDAGDHALGHHLAGRQQILGAGHRQDQRAQIFTTHGGIALHVAIDLEPLAHEALALGKRVQRAHAAPHRRLGGCITQQVPAQHQSERAHGARGNGRHQRRQLLRAAAPDWNICRQVS